jgi:putative DNA primase/helicase
MDSANNADDALASRAELPQLLPHHLAELRASGLSDAMIRASGIHSEANYETLAAILNWPKYPGKMAPAIVFPFVDAAGRNGYTRVKPDRPRVSKGKPVKYESPKGRPNEIYLPPGMARVLARPRATLVITEGEKKSLKAAQDRFPCVGLVGVWGWKATKSERLITALDRVDWKGRFVVIVFDSDMARNKNVQDAAKLLAAALRAGGATVRIPRLPDGPPDEQGNPTKMGLDDFLVAHGAEALKKLLNDDESKEPESLDDVPMKTPAGTLDPATEVTEYLEADAIDGLHRMRFWRGGFWRWRDGCYREVSQSTTRAQFIRHVNETYQKVTTGIIGNCMDQLRAVSLLDEFHEPPTWLDEPPKRADGTHWHAADVLATRNALVNLPALVAGEPFEHRATPRFLSTAALDYGFRVDAPPPSGWLAFLDELWPDDPESIGTLQEWFGYCLTIDTRLQKILFAVGPKRSGKGTIARVIRGTVGEANVAGPTLASLATNFGLWPLLGKTLAIVSDARLSGRADLATVTERLLSISGEDAVTIDGKFRDAVTCKLPCRLMIFSNELPRLVDASGALAGRMILLRMVRSFYGGEDPGLTDRLLLERPGILLWAVEGWRRLRERGHFVQPASGLEMLGELNALASPVGAFVEERCAVGPEYRVAVERLFAEWKSWCEAKGRKEAGTEQTFGRDLRAVVSALRLVQPRNGEHRFRAYEGIGLRG